MKKIIVLVLTMLLALTLIPFGCGGDNTTGEGSGNGGGGNEGGGTTTLAVSMSETATSVKTNVGLVLYASVTENGSPITDATVDFTFDNGTKSMSGATIGAIDGQQYLRATVDGSYIVKVKATKGTSTAESQATITANDEVVFSSIYNNKYSPDTGHPSPSNYAHTVVGKGIYYYSNNGACENAICFQDIWKLNGEKAYAGNFELAFTLKVLPQTVTDNNSTIFFGFFAGANSLGDVLKLTRGGKATVIDNEITGSPLNFNNTLYIKLDRFVTQTVTTWALFTSTDGVNYSLYGKTEKTAGTEYYDWDLTGFNIFSQTPLALGAYTVSSNPTVNL